MLSVLFDKILSHLFTIFTYLVKANSKSISFNFHRANFTLLYNCLYNTNWSFLTFFVDKLNCLVVTRNVCTVFFLNYCKHYHSNLKTQLNSCFSNYVKKCEKCLNSNPKTFWSYINTLRLDSYLLSSMTYREAELKRVEVASGFSEFFKSIVNWLTVALHLLQL